MRNLTNMLGISNHGSSIINLMVPLSEEQRKTVAQSRFASSKKQTVFFRICLSQSMEVVEYFLKNCSPDVDEICELSIDDDDEKTIVYVSPLWSAAHGNKIDLARILLKYGADVNLQTNRKSTPLRIACREKHVDMVKFLVANGADITAKNVDGCTCLMSGTGNAEILKYLIEIGADVNAKETGHWCATALHYAVYTEKIELVQILVDAGADMSIKDKSGHAPYACAALNTNTEMMEYLLRMNTEPVENVIKGYELLGSAFLAEGNNVGIQHLIKACSLKSRRETYKYGAQFDTPKRFFHLKELKDDDDTLKNLPTDKKIQLGVSLLIGSQHLRVNSDFFLYLAMTYANVLRCEGNLKNYHEIFIFVYDSILGNKDWLHENVAHAVVHCIQSVSKLLIGDSELRDKQDRIERLMQMVSSHLQGASEQKELMENKSKKAIYQTLMFGFLYLIKMHLTLTSNATKNISIHDVVTLNPKTEYEDTLLHLLVDRDTFSENDPICLSSASPMMDIDVISCLLRLGIPTDSRNDSDSTPLFTLMEGCLDGRCDESNEIVNLLLASGAHLDIPDKYGGDPMNYCYRYDIPAVKYQTLKCLTARVVIKENIYYYDHLPVELITFVKHHTPLNEEEII